MRIKITFAEPIVHDIVVSFCNLHFINYEVSRAPVVNTQFRITIYEIESHDIILLLKKLFDECDRLDYGSITIE